MSSKRSICGRPCNKATFVQTLSLFCFVFGSQCGHNTALMWGSTLAFCLGRVASTWQPVVDDGLQPTTIAILCLIEAQGNTFST